MGKLRWEDGRRFGYSFAEVAQTDRYQYTVDRNPDSDGWVGIVFDLTGANHRRQFFDKKEDAKNYCAKIRIENGE